VFARALFQLAIGVAVGASIAILVAVVGEGDQIVREGPGLLLAVSGLMMLVGLFSCVVPAAGGLRIQPTEALRQRW
jgi:ABC-type lipoprotein release transport system permease subunit